MLKKVLAWLPAALTLLAFCMAALAESFTGSIIAASQSVVTVDETVVPTSVYVRPGAAVAAGDVLASLRTTRLYAPEDGTVARILADPGDSVDGTLLEIAPVQRYTVYCTVDGAWEAAQNTIVHAGERLYLRCTADGSHKGTGIVTEIEGGEYRLMTTAGALQVGETVYLYRNSAFEADSRVGIGTVIATPTVSCEAEGTLTALYVQPGETVQRGQLLCELAPAGGAVITAPAGGIITAVAQAGIPLSSGEEAFAIVTPDVLCVEAELEEADAANLRQGSAVKVILSNDPDETVLTGSIAGIIHEAGRCTLTITCADLPLRLGLTATILIGPQDGGE